MGVMTEEMNRILKASYISINEAALIPTTDIDLMVLLENKWETNDTWLPVRIFFVPKERYARNFNHGPRIKVWYKGCRTTNDYIPLPLLPKKIKYMPQSPNVKIGYEQELVRDIVQFDRTAFLSAFSGTVITVVDGKYVSGDEIDTYDIVDMMRDTVIRYIDAGNTYKEKYQPTELKRYLQRR
jgi:hypothetical protein